MPEKTLALRTKRALDALTAAGALAALAPLVGGLVALELAFHGWPPVFVQRRPGLHGRVFSMRKLRTMTNERGPDGRLLPDAARLTPFGSFLRSTSLDELPELWNVLVGDMSLVGPRPLLTEYLERYTPEQMRRHDMPPGITGWAQVNGRNAISWEEKFALDLEYIERWSLGLDLRILARTVVAVVRRGGISAAGDATMPVFMGTAAVHA